MFWLVPALVGAFFKSSSSFFRKKASKNLSGSVFLWFSSFLSTIVIFPFVAGSLSDVSGLFTKDLFVLLGVVLPLMAATIMNVKALSKDELSFVAPLNGFVPVFTLLSAWIILGEIPPYAGTLGILLIFAGTYVMALRPQKVNWYDPIVFLLKHPAALLSFGVALGYAVNTTFIKMASDIGYSPVAILFASQVLSTLLASYIFIFRSQRSQIIKAVQTDYKPLLGAIVSSLIANYLHMVATSLTFASYAIAARRFDSIFSVLLGWKFLNETNIRNKLIGATVIVAGCIFLALN